MKSEEIRKLIEINERVMAELDKLKAEIEQTLPDSRRRTERALADLRRAGYLR